MLKIEMLERSGMETAPWTDLLVHSNTKRCRPPLQTMGGSPIYYEESLTVLNYCRKLLLMRSEVKGKSLTEVVVSHGLKFGCTY